MKSLWLIVKSPISNIPQKMWLAYHIKTQYLWFFTRAGPTFVSGLDACHCATQILQVLSGKFKGANLREYTLVNYG